MVFKNMGDFSSTSTSWWVSKRTGFGRNMALADPRNKTAFKLVLVGEASVGKSCLVVRFVKDVFLPEEPPTIGAAFLTHKITYNDLENNTKDTNVTKHIEIWDTAGEERYRCLVSMYYRGASAAIVAYDITSYESFDAVKFWVQELRSSEVMGNIVIIVVGNKSDLEAQREVSSTEARMYAEQNDVQHIETSAKSGCNVTQLFEIIARSLPDDPSLENKDGMVRLESPPSSTTIVGDGESLVSSDEQRGGMCCQ